MQKNPRRIQAARLATYCLVLMLTSVIACAPPRAPVSVASRNADWKTTGGEPGNTRYSYVDQINRLNVAQLRVAWIYHTGDADSAR